MIKQTNRNIVDILNELPSTYKVLDAGASFAPLSRANTIIDIVPYERINWDQLRGDKNDIKFNKNSYVQFDMCSKEKWPFKDKEFDYSICIGTLEDIRDPIGVISELIRVSKAGYIQIPNRYYETMFDLEIKGLAGASHHRWIVDLHNDELRFTFKHLYVNSKVLNKNKLNPKKMVLGSDDRLHLRLEWKDNFKFYEWQMMDTKDLFGFFLEKKLTDKEVWQIFRKVQNKNFFIKWLSYLKNTNSFFNKIFLWAKNHKMI